MKNVWFIHCRRRNRIGIYVVQLTWLVWVFSIRLRQSYHISDSYIIFFLSGKLGRGREHLGNPFCTQPSLRVLMCSLWTYACVSVDERTFASMCPECGVVSVSGVLGSSVWAWPCSMQSYVTGCMFLWHGGRDLRGGVCMCVSAIDTIRQLDVIPSLASLMTRPFSSLRRARTCPGHAHSWEELHHFLCPKVHVFSVTFPGVLVRPVL